MNLNDLMESSDEGIGYGSTYGYFFEDDSGYGDGFAYYDHGSQDGIGCDSGAGNGGGYIDGSGDGDEALDGSGYGANA